MFGLVRKSNVDELDVAWLQYSLYALLPVSRVFLDCRHYLHVFPVCSIPYISCLQYGVYFLTAVNICVFPGGSALCISWQYQYQYRPLSKYIPLEVIRAFPGSSMECLSWLRWISVYFEVAVSLAFLGSVSISISQYLCTSCLQYSLYFLLAVYCVFLGCSQLSVYSWQAVFRVFLLVVYRVFLGYSEYVCIFWL